MIKSPNLSPTLSSTSSPVEPLLDAHVDYPLFHGVLAEVFVSSHNPEYLVKGQRFVDAMEKMGIEMPISRPQERLKVPDTTTEVRYFFNNDENKDIAKKVQNILISAGVPSDKIRLSFVDDPTTPDKFIQVSMADSAFN